MKRNDNIDKILSSIGPLPRELLSGRLCGILCEICPLRAWKSSGVTAIECQQILRDAISRQSRFWRFRSAIRFKEEIVSTNAYDA